MDFEMLVEAEFKRLVKLGVLEKFVLKENQNEHQKFWIAGITLKTNTAYTIQHRRENKLRSWRLDNAVKFLSSLGVLKLEVNCLKKY